MITPPPMGEHLFAFESAYWRPEPCFAYQKILTQFATAAADVSDGLLADVGHISKLCEAGAVLNFDALPFSMGGQSWADAQDDPVQARQTLVSFGDDYQVVFTANAENRQAIFDAARKSKLKLTLVGSLLGGEGSVCLDVDGQEMSWPKKGFSHK